MSPDSDWTAVSRGRVQALAIHDGVACLIFCRSVEAWYCCLLAEAASFAGTVLSFHLRSCLLPA